MIWGISWRATRMSPSAARGVTVAGVERLRSLVRPWEPQERLGNFVTHAWVGDEVVRPYLRHPGVVW